MKAPSDYVLADYVLEPLREDAELTLYRARQHGSPSTDDRVQTGGPIAFVVAGSQPQERFWELKAAARMTSGASSGGKSKLGRIYSSLESCVRSRLSVRQGDYATK